MDVKKISKCPPFTVFGIVRFFKSNNFCLEIRFSQAQHAISDFCFFKRPLFFLCDFLFSSKPPQFFTRTETFCEHKAFLKIFGTMRLAEDLHQKNFRKISKIFFLNFLFFLKGLRLRKMSFLLFPVGEELFSRFMGIPSGVFGVKLMKF